ncbi:MAG: hypothetical protein QNL33_07415 [Akkermansiaceae bacterium]|jgi:hypothetical protein
MKDNNNFIPRHGSPLFYPQDPSEGFQGGAGGMGRRKFLKRTGGATAGAFLSWNALSAQARAEQQYPYSDSQDLYMVCIKSPKVAELTYDSGKVWDTGVLVDWGIRAYYSASGPTAGDFVKRGGSFHLDGDLMVQVWRDDPTTSGDEGVLVGSVNPKEDQEVIFGGSGVEFHPPSCADPRSDTYDEGGGGINQGTVEGNLGFGNGILSMIGRVTSADVAGFGVGAFGGSISLPSSNDNLADFKAQIEWSFSIMTAEEYKNRYGSYPE